jgi:hypothetical protein
VFVWDSCFSGVAVEAVITTNQRAATDALNPAPQAAALKSSLSELEGACLDISDLYNTYAQPHGVSTKCDTCSDT